MTKTCIDCGTEFNARTSQKRCPDCQTAFKKERSRKASYNHAVQSGRIRNPGVGSGGLNKGITRPENRYRLFKKDACELCGSTRFLCVHHIDENRTNCSEYNLMTVCKSCHQRIHHAADHLNEAK